MLFEEKLRKFLFMSACKCQDQYFYGLVMCSFLDDFGIMLF